MRILVINSGSSSIKYQLIQLPENKVLAKGVIEKIGEEGSAICNHHSGLKIILKKIKDFSCVGHRVVHGGEAFREAILIDDKVIAKIKECCQLAPLHNPPNLEGIYACKELLPDIPQVAVFDTAFHQSIPQEGYIYALPFEFYQNFGIRKYGFHGTSHKYVAIEAAKKIKKPLKKINLITCHLGNGCSVTAIRKGKSIDTSMGFTPLEGLVMGTRSGDLDPAIITYLILEKKYSPQDIDTILNKHSGLLGVSGVSNDMRKIESAARKGNKRARLALDIFVYRIKKYIGSYIAILGKIDILVFTAGIGENQKDIRDNVCQNLFTNFKIKPKVLVIPTNEELMIAFESYKVVTNNKRED
ncbi:MAG: acetate kinase [Candidatus Omnitrophota bacterium]